MAILLRIPTPEYAILRARAPKYRPGPLDPEIRLIPVPTSIPETSSPSSQPLSQPIIPLPISRASSCMLLSRPAPLPPSISTSAFLLRSRSGLRARPYSRHQKPRSVVYRLVASPPISTPILRQLTLEEQTLAGHVPRGGRVAVDLVLIWTRPRSWTLTAPTPANHRQSTGQWCLVEY